ncbi:MAG TPA: hypothetical protein VM512_08105 [Burkholderiaceae bacterium]|jgi:hypothetical protein|nr:hypothetical protein [Burkholderiaceae bacterium]
MDFDAISALEELLLGACLLLAPVPPLALAAREGRRLVAAAPGMLGFALFVVAFAHLHLARGEAPDILQMAYNIAWALVFLALLPSVLSLRNRAWGLLHLITCMGMLWAFFIGGLLLARDSP